jgi:hypothetical protein
MFALFEERPGHFERFRHDRRELHRFLDDGDLASRQARHVEQVVHESREMTGLPQDDFQLAGRA